MILLKQDNENDYLAKKKAGTVFADFWAARDTLFYRFPADNPLPLSWQTRDRDDHEIFYISSFTLTTGSGELRELGHLTNGISKGLVLSFPLLILKPMTCHLQYNL